MCWKTGLAAQVSRGGRGCGISASHSSSPWWPGSAVSSRCSAVVPLLGRPVTKIGRSMATSACSGMRCPSRRSRAAARPARRAGRRGLPSGRAGSGRRRGHRTPGSPPGRRCSRRRRSRSARSAASRTRAGPRRSRRCPARSVSGHVGSARTQWWYSPQLTSRHWPVIARASGEARNSTASAISSGSGSRPRSMFAAVSA